MILEITNEDEIMYIDNVLRFGIYDKLQITMSKDGDIKGIEDTYREDEYDLHLYNPREGSYATMCWYVRLENGTEKTKYLVVNHMYVMNDNGKTIKVVKSA